MWPWTPLDFSLNVHFDIIQEYLGGLAWNWLVSAILRTFFILEQCVQLSVYNFVSVVAIICCLLSGAKLDFIAEKF